MTCNANKKRHGGKDRNLHDLFWDVSNYPTIRRCIQAGMHSTTNGNYMMSNVSNPTHSNASNTNTHTLHVKDDEPRKKRIGSQAAGRNKYPRAGVNSNRFAVLERGEEDAQKQRELGADSIMHPTVEKTNVISADVCTGCP